MIEIHVDARELLRWAKYFESEMPRRVNQALSRALNVAGEGIVRSYANYVAQQAGLDPHDVEALMRVRGAAEDELVWELDASAIAPPSQDWSRPWNTRDTKQFERSTLVKIMTVGDDKVCMVCEALEQNSPYTLEEARARLPAHPNCRCLLGPWSSQRRIEVTFAGSGLPPELLNMRQIGERVAGELAVALKVTT